MTLEELSIELRWLAEKAETGESFSNSFTRLSLATTT